MGQTRKHSVLETITNTSIGYIVAVASQYAIFPLFDVHIAPAEHAAMGVFFTVVSIIRSYILRRTFNTLMLRKEGI